MTRVAVIGVGAMGKHHARVYREIPGAELVAVVDRDRELAEGVAQLHQVPAYSELDQMLQNESPDAVSVAVPTGAHFAVAKVALEAGCHVLVEKPIAETPAEAHALVQIAERAGRILAVGHIERFNPAIVELKRRLDAGQLGRIYQIHARRLGPFPARIQDVGVVMDLAIHDIDIMHYLLANQVTRIFAESKQEVHLRFEDLFVGVLRFADTTVGLLEINWLTPRRIRKLYVTGERGMFRVNYITQSLCFYENADAVAEAHDPAQCVSGVSQGAKIQFCIPKQEPLRAELESFLACVRGEESLIVTGREATTTLILASMLADVAYTGGVREVIQDEISRSATDTSHPGNGTVAGNGATLPAFQTGV